MNVQILDKLFKSPSCFGDLLDARTLGDPEDYGLSEQDVDWAGFCQWFSKKPFKSVECEKRYEAGDPHRFEVFRVTLTNGEVRHFQCKEYWDSHQGGSDPTYQWVTPVQKMVTVWSPLSGVLEHQGRPFLIGSRACGAPRPDSDIDLVVCLTDPKSSTLQKFGQTPKGIRFGMLNLIIVGPEDTTLKEETQALIALRDKRGTPITREEAIKALALSGAHYGEDAGNMKGALSLPPESSGGLAPRRGFEGTGMAADTVKGFKR